MQEDTETLEDRLRKATRHFTSRLSETEVLSLGLDLARELATAHGEVPPRHPDLDPGSIPIIDGKPRLPRGTTVGEVGKDLFRLGALLNGLVLGSKPEVSWRLDGPPPAPATNLFRRALLERLGSPRRAVGYSTAAEAAEALERAIATPEERACWSLFRGGPDRRGYRTVTAPVGWVNAWESSLGSVVGSPVITTGLVIAPTADGRLVFLDRKTGHLLHELRLGSPVESSPAIADKLVCIGTDDGELVAVDIAAGAEAYRLRLGKLVRSSPLVVGERLIVGVIEGKGSGGLVALDALTGKLLWRRKLGPTFSSPALAGSSLLVGSDDGSLYALDLEQGRPLWTLALGGKVRSTPAVVDDLAVVGDFEGHLVAIHIGQGTRAWTLETGHALYSSPAVSAAVCAVGCNEGHVHGAQIAAGTRSFEVKTRGPVVASPLALSERFLCGSTDGDLYLFDAEGRILQQAALATTGIQSSTAIHGDMVFLGSGTGIHALRLIS